MKRIFYILSACLLLIFLSCENPSGDRLIVVSAPAFSPVGGTYSDDVAVSLTCDTAGAEISWKKETSGSWMKYEGPFVLTESTQIEARAIYNGIKVSDTVVADYRISRLEQVATPVFSPEPSPFFQSAVISLSCGTAGAGIQYRLNGSGAWMDYSHPLTISHTTSIEARAVKAGMSDSVETETVTYELDDSLTIATYNVENFDLGGSQSVQFSHIASFVKSEDIDILVVNEMQTDDSDRSGFSEALDGLNYSMPFRGNTLMSDGYNAIGVWSRYPVTLLSGILASAGPRSILRFKVTAGDEDLWFYGCHLKSGPNQSSFDRRVVQAEALEQYIMANHDPVNDLIVVLGDMNTMGYDDGDAENEDFSAGGTLEKLRLQSDGNASNDFVPVNYNLIPSSFTNPGWDSLLDHIILSPSAYSDHYRSGTVRVPRPSGDGTYGASDHYPVVLDLNFN